jgi:hypothetical protein
MTAHKGLVGCLAIAVLATFLMRFNLTMAEHGEGVGAAAWRLFRYFTIWGNFLVGVWAVRFLLRGPLSPRIEGALLLTIVAIGIVYHVLLAATADNQGAEIWVDAMLHTVIPIAYAALWLIFGSGDLRVGDVLLWLVLPLIYCIYAMLRGLADGTFPYFFLDPTDIGILGVSAYIIGLLVAFAIGGLVIFVVGRTKGRVGLAP